MNLVLTNVDFLDATKTGLKVVRVGFYNKYTKIDLGFIYSSERSNTIKISDKIFIKDYNQEKKYLIECVGINLNEEIELKSVKDFRYFSLKFEAFDSVKDKLSMWQNEEYGTKIAIIAIKLPEESS